MMAPFSTVLLVLNNGVASGLSQALSGSDCLYPGTFFSFATSDSVGQ